MSSLYPDRTGSRLSDYGYRLPKEEGGEDTPPETPQHPPGSTGLPFLPGYTFTDPTKKHFGRKSTMDMRGGSASIGEPKVAVSPSRRLRTTSSLAFGTPATTSLSPDMAMTTGKMSMLSTYSVDDSITDQHVVFHAWMKESVVESLVESGFRYRYYTIIFFLADGTTQIVERNVRNSGMKQGPTLARHCIPKEDVEGEFYGLQDFIVGNNIPIYGHVYHVYSCSAEARDALEEMGIDVPPNEERPIGEYERKREIEERVDTHIPGYRTDEFKRYTERLLGFPSHLLEGDTLAKFIKMDRKVLKVFCVWDNRPQLFGDLEYFLLFYFLADDTAQIIELKSQKASSRGSFGSFVKRSKLPKNFEGVKPVGYKYSREELVTEEDLIIGGHLNIYGRDLLIVQYADPFTEKYMREQHGVEASEPALPKPVLEREIETSLPPPPHNKIGREEDSIENVKRLIPKVPKSDVKKYIEMDGVVLRFTMKFVTDDPEEQEREFILIVYMADDSMSVVEKRQRNSGREGGTFLRRMHMRTEDDDRYINPSDIHVGETLNLYGHQFQITGCDEFTQSFLEGHPRPHVELSPDEFHKEVRKKFYQMKGNVRTLFRELDSDHDGVITLDEFEELLKRFDFRVSDENMLALMRRFDLNGDGKISYHEFVQAATDPEFTFDEHHLGKRTTKAEKKGDHDVDHLTDEEYATLLLDAEEEKKQRKLLERVISALRHQVFYRHHLFTESLSRQFDFNRDGAVSQKEFLSGLERMGILIPTTDRGALIQMMFSDDHGEVLDVLDYRQFLKKMNYYEGALDKSLPTKVKTVKRQELRMEQGTPVFPGSYEPHRRQKFGHGTQ